MENKDTEQQFKDVMAECRSLFAKKLHDYGASWRILRPSSLTDQLFIKAKRIRSLEIKQVSLVGEGIRPEFIALINYGIVGLIQIEKGFADQVDITPEDALAMYDEKAKEALDLMIKKNHDYDEAYRNCWLKDKGMPLYNIGRLLEKNNLSVSRRYDSTIEDIKRLLCGGNQLVAVIDNALLEGIENNSDKTSPNHAVA